MVKFNVYISPRHVQIGILTIGNSHYTEKIQIIPEVISNVSREGSDCRNKANTGFPVVESETHGNQIFAFLHAFLEAKAGLATLDIVIIVDDIVREEAPMQKAWNEWKQWRHNERDGVSNHRRLDGLFHRLFRRRSKNTLKLRVAGLCEGNSQMTGDFPHQGPVTWKLFPVPWHGPRVNVLKN